jgi:hypothetical protein
MDNKDNKYLIVTFDNGDKFKVPITAVANHRAVHHADGAVHYGEEEIDPNANIDVWSERYKREYNIAMDDHHIIKVWAQKNMGWSDISGIAMQIDGESYNHCNKFSYAEFEVKEINDG